MAVNIKRSTLILPAVIFFVFAYSTAFSEPVYESVGKVTNETKPSEWQQFTLDITSFVSGSTGASLSFDLRNDGPDPPLDANSTTTEVLLGIDGSDFFVHLDYTSGFDSSHWRDVRLEIDGVIYRDQFRAFNNHLGSEFGGTAMESCCAASNVLGKSGFDASTYIMSPETSPSRPN
jgi:hypothetical protein